MTRENKQEESLEKLVESQREQMYQLGKKHGVVETAQRIVKMAEGMKKEPNEEWNKMMKLAPEKANEALVGSQRYNQALSDLQEKIKQEFEI